MRPVAVLLFFFAFMLPPAAAGAETTLAQSGALDDAQRDLIRNFYQGQQGQGPGAATRPDEKKGEDAKKKSKKSDKKKSPEKPKKPNKPKDAKAKDKDKGKGKGKERDKPAQARPAAPRLEPGAVLPPDLPRLALPRGLDSKLPKLPSGQQRVVVGDDVALIEKKTGRILDVLEGALKGTRQGGGQ